VISAIDADGLVVELGRRPILHGLTSPGDEALTVADATGPLPPSSATGEFQKVTQVVPVRVAILDRHELPLVPGMSTTVRTYRH
jgi:hypothetical protein